ncbi:uncharacterized protein F5891DRAFT_357602 [Suillus fuscotomentosus]|uniref:Uncharacterized protein n=1 Tax=Suillus fuscotomentosus TaxID=1912939 RepID=A0AAD4HR80_9AGAM|nr:uncharacterized protein F5891DRAFT_357602 [Suillus fuscotomentosus]KAG1907125.1 hypothetical protein F5891DRAFT_357602 [Suillus fuscotomentosus]
MSAQHPFATSRNKLHDDSGVGSTAAIPELRSRKPTEDHAANSPTSTTISESAGSFYRMDEPLRPTLRSLPVNLNTPRKITIRSDIALVTCFDPADKELYNLWAPKP